MCEAALRPPSLESSNGSTTLRQNREPGCRGREEEEHQTGMIGLRIPPSTTPPTSLAPPSRLYQIASNAQQQQQQIDYV
jgi:hypothetical protein